MNVQFNEEQDTPLTRVPQYGKTPSGIVGFLIRHGIAKNARSASVVLIGIIIVCIVATIIIMSASGNSGASEPLPPYIP